jgi:hypothetical protein
MSIWDQFFQLREEYLRNGDAERLRLTYPHSDGFACQETDPDRALAILTEGRQLAQRLNEPWFVLFYDVWRVIALLSYKHDFRNALDLAIQCALEMRKPANAQHAWRFAAFNNLVNAYAGIDPVGYDEPIRQALAYLEAEIPPGPNDDRYVMLNYKRRFLADSDRPDEAYRVAHEQLALADSDPNRHNAHWYTIAVHNHLYGLCAQKGEWEGVASHATTVEELARRVDQSQINLAEALAWQALVARRAGDELSAGKLYRRAVSRMARLRRPPAREYFDALCLYHEAGGDPARALRVRDRELESVLDKGQLAYECRVRIQRCRLLRDMGKLCESDLAAAREAVRKLKQPEKQLREIDALVT